MTELETLEKNVAELYAAVAAAQRAFNAAKRAYTAAAVTLAPYEDAYITLAAKEDALATYKAAKATAAQKTYSSDLADGFRAGLLRLKKALQNTSSE